MYKNKENIFKYTYYLFTFLIIILGSYWILYNANWIFGDDHEWLSSTAIGQFSSISTYQKRFFWHYDFNILLLTPWHGVIAHYSIVTISFIITILANAILYIKITNSVENKLAKRYGYLYAAFFLIILILNNKFFNVFLDVSYSDRVVIFLLSLFNLLYFQAIKTDKSIYYILCLIIGFISAYSKETVFGIFLVISLINLTFNFRNLKKKQIYFYLGLVLSGIVFLTLYYFCSFNHNSSIYTDFVDRAIYNKEFFMKFFIKRERIFIATFALLLFRIYNFLKPNNNRTKDIYYDSLLFGAFYYFLGFISLRLTSIYYFTPCFVLINPALLYFTLKSYNKSKLIPLLILIALLFCYSKNIEFLKDDIIFNQKARATYIPTIRKYGEIYNKNNKKFIWVISNEQKFLDSTYSSLNTGINYLNKTKNKDIFIITDNLPDLKNKNYYIFYSINSKKPNKNFSYIKKKLQENSYDKCEQITTMRKILSVLICSYKG